MLAFKFFLSSILIASPLFAREIKTFTVKHSILINRPMEQVFHIAANARYDSLWRSEVNKMVVIGPFQEGSRYIEDARLGVHKHYITTVELLIKSFPTTAIYETIAQNPYYLKSFRLFEKISEHKTRFTYKVIIEKAMIEDITEVPLPPLIIKRIYRRRLKKYMKKLKSLLLRHSSGNVSFH